MNFDNEKSLSEFGMKILNEEQYTDATIVCGSFSFPIHRAILCAQSKYFRAAFGGKFVESEKSSIDLSSEEPVVVSRLILFLYTHKYLNTQSKSTFFSDLRDQQSRWLRHMESLSNGGELLYYDSNDEDSFGLHLHAKMYVAGDKFLQDDLRKYAEDRLKDIAMYSIPTIYILNDNDRRPMYAAARTIYLQTPNTNQNRKVRNILVYLVQKHNYLCLETHSLLRDLFAEVPEFAADLVTLGRVRRRIYCGHCAKNILLKNQRCKCDLLGICEEKALCCAVNRGSEGLHDVKCWDCSQAGYLDWNPKTGSLGK